MLGSDNNVVEKGNFGNREIIALKNLYSQEQTAAADGSYTSLLRGITFGVHEGERWGILSSGICEADVLCRILGNISPYYSGFCRLGPMGTPKKKKRILDHLFYISGGDMLDDGMTVLEQLMIADGGLEAADLDATLDLQEHTLDLLDLCGLPDIALSETGKLPLNTRILVEMIISGFTQADIIIINLTGIRFSISEINSAGAIYDILTERGKTVVTASLQPSLIGMLCDHALLIHDGVQLYSGTVEELEKTCDNVCYLIVTENPAEISAKLDATDSGWKCDISGNTIYVMNTSGHERNSSEFFRTLAECGVDPDNIKINRGRVENSFIELMRRYDMR